MATSSRTDVNAAFGRLSYAGKTSRRFLQDRSIEMEEGSNWFHGIHSNALKRSKGSHITAGERSKGHSNAHAKRSQESNLSVGKNTQERGHLKVNEHLDLQYLNNTTNSSEQCVEKKRSNEADLGVQRDSEERHIMNEYSADESDTSARVKQSGKRGFRKKNANADRVKRLKQSTTKKDNSWRQNSRSRRLVANARERSRIHILSDAFENLRRAVPSYSQDQKLSKLAILKLATYYISALANLAESDTSARSLKQFADCVAHCTKALQTEGRSRRKHF